MTARGKAKFTFTRRVSHEPMTREQWAVSEDLLAKLVARLIAADCPELQGEEEHEDSSNEATDSD